MNITWTPERIKVCDRLFAEYHISAADIEDAATTISERVAEAVLRLQDSPFEVSGTYCGHSGGKDSVLVRYLADLANTAPITLHTVKPDGVRNAVHPLTRQFLYDCQDRPLVYVPERYMEDVLEQYGLTTQIDGTRASEAYRRDGRDVGLVVNGESRSRSEIALYMANGLFGLNFIYPIHDWTDAEVWAAIFVYGIPYSPEYEQ